MANASRFMDVSVSFSHSLKMRKNWLVALVVSSYFRLTQKGTKVIIVLLTPWICKAQELSHCSKMRRNWLVALVVSSYYEVNAQRERVLVLFTLTSFGYVKYRLFVLKLFFWVFRVSLKKCDEIGHLRWWPFPSEQRTEKSVFFEFWLFLDIIVKTQLCVTNRFPNDGQGVNVRGKGVLA